MSDERPQDLLGGLPRTRPHRRSQKRPARDARQVETPAQPAKPPSGKPPARAKRAPAARKPASNGPERAAQPRERATPARGRPRLAQPAQPPGTPRVPRREIPASPPAAGDVVSTAVQAVGEIAQIGASLGARALRNALRRLPRP
jgi:hypothetical protein